MEKAVFMSILEQIVEGFEDLTFKAAMASAKSAGDVGQLIALPSELQTRIFLAHGLDPQTASASFKAAGREFGLLPEAAPWLGRMKAALQ